MKFKTIWGKASILLICAFFLTVSLSYAQRISGKLMGVVTDEEGVALPGVTVEISSPALMGGVHSQVTPDKGTFRFVNLPPGTYSLVCKLEGFQTVEKKNIKVLLGMTVTENISLKPKAIEEYITVTAASPGIDVTKSSTSTNYDKDQLEKLPLDRYSSFFDIIKQTPGFTTNYGWSSFSMSAFGSNPEENATFMDGLDMSSPSDGLSWLWPTADMFEEVEVSGIGAPAEYGNFTGAVINIVTKSGGNTFSGSASYYGQFQRLTGDNNPDPYDPVAETGWHSYRRVKFYDIAFALGGPLIKDKIWFFSLYQKQLNSEYGWQDDPDFPREVHLDEQFLKISTQITDKHRLVLGFDRDYWYLSTYSPDPWNLPETICAETDLSYAWNAHYTWLISSNSFFELKYSGYSQPGELMPAFGGDIHQPIHYDLATGVSSNGPWYPFEYIVTRHQVNATVSYFAEEFLAGDHDFKFGVQFNRGTTENWGSFGGGKFYLDWYGEPYLLYEQDAWHWGGVIQNIGAFVDDSWKFGDRLTVNLGLRFDHHNGSIPAYPIMKGWTETGERGEALDDLVVWNCFSPRVGLAFQLTSDQKTLLKASYGRYYVPPYAANWESPGPNVPDYKSYYWNGTQWVLWHIIPGEMGYSVNPSLKNPCTDQFSIGLEREILPDFSSGATFIYKKQEDIIGFINRAGIYEQVERVSPDNGKTYAVWNQLNPGVEDHFLTNPEGWGQTYMGLIFTLNKRYSNRWMMNASLTLSKAEGLNLASHQNGGFGGVSLSLVSYTGKFGIDPNNLINAKAPLNLDRSWSLKVSAAYNFPFDILASLNLTYQQGRPKVTFIRIYDLDQKPFSFTEIIAEPRGTERFDNLLLIDFRLQKTFNIYKTLKLRAFVDVFNLLNDDTVVGYRSYAMWSANYGVPREMPLPGRAQVGLKLEF